MGANALNLVPRWRSPFLVIPWLAWLPVAIWLTWEPLLWHLEYFRNPGPEFHRLMLFALPCLAAVIVFYRWFRQKGAWRYEPVVFASVLVVGLTAYQPKATLITVWIFLAAYGGGRFVRERTGLTTKSPAEEISLSAGVGLACLIFLLFWLGLLGLYDPWSLAAVLGICVLGFQREIRKLPTSLLGLMRSWASTTDLKQPWMAALIAFAGISLVCSMMVTLAPSLTHDTLMSHLPAVRFYAAEQALKPLSFSSYSYYPQGFEVLMTLAYVLGGQPAAQMVSPLFFGLTLLLAFALARECGVAPAPAVAGVILAASIPFLHWTGSVSKNDMAMAFFILAALHCYLRGRQSPGSHWLRLSVFFLAASFGVKHVALFGAASLGLLYLYTLWRRPRRFRESLILASIFVALGLCWQVRTFVLTGNPVYPAGLDWAVEPLRPNALRPPEWRRIPHVLIPWVVHFKYKFQAFESPSDNPMGVFLVLFVPLWIVLRRKPRLAAESTCLIFSGIYFLYWGAVWPTISYAIVPIMIIFLLTTARVWALLRESPAAIRGLVEVCLGYNLLFCLLVTMILEINGPQLRLFTGRIDKEQYLHETLLSYPPLAYLRSHAGPEDYILSVNNCSNAYAPDVGRFHCEFFGDRTDALERVPEAMRKHSYRFLLLPKTHVGNTIAAELGPSYPREVVFEDDYVFIYELQEAVVGRGEHE